jgi:hypothetical protein
MSFHKGGVYAVNFGLDSDNILRIGGWSASANRWELDMSGNNWAASSFRAPIFYDSNNTAYYTDPASTSVLNGLTVGGGTIATTSGSPAYYMARAWVSWNGTGAVSIRNSVNISSISDNGTGDYTVNFATAMPDALYCLQATRCGSSSGSYILGGAFYATAPTSSAARVINVYPGVAAADDDYCMVTIFR